MPTLLVRAARAVLLLPLLPLLALLPWLLRALLPLRPRAPEPRPVIGREPRRMPASVTVVIVSWDGRDLLAVCLPPLLQALARAPVRCDLLVVDNGSRDGTADWLAREHPSVRTLRLPHNRGFGEGNNAAFAAPTGEAILLLNNDMIVEPDFIAPLLAGFRDADVFAVASQVLQEPDRRREETGNTAGSFERGEIHWRHDPIPDRAGPELPVLWAGGGAALFDAAKLRALGGFDRIFSPAYVEDADLSWRAWQRGWRSLLAPASRVLHRHRGTSARRFTPAALHALVRANHWLFLLKNLADRDLLREFLRQLPRNLARDFLRDGPLHLLRVGARVLRRLPAVARARRRPAIDRIPDRAILYLDRRWIAPAADRAAGPPRALVVCALLPRAGVHAGGQRVFRLLERLSRSFRITVLSYADTAEEAAAARELAFCEQVEVIPRGLSPFVPNPLRLDPPAIVAEFGNPAMQLAVRRHLGSGRYDLVQVEYLQAAFLLPRWQPLPAVLTDHEVQSLAFARQVAAQRGLRRLPAWFAWLRMRRHERRQLARFDRVVVTTDVDAAALLELDPRAPVVVHQTGVDTTRLRPAPEPAADRIVFVGYFRHEPNVAAMHWFTAEILPRIRAEVPGAELAVVGAAPPESIRALARLPGVTVTGRVPEIAPHVHAARVYVVPLRDGAGIRGKILEAWALGRAVVTTRIGAAGLHATDGVHLLIADGADAFAAAVVRLLRDDALRRRLVSAALRRVDAEYSWEVKAREHERLWCELLDASGSPYGASPWRLAPRDVACRA